MDTCIHREQGVWPSVLQEWGASLELGVQSHAGTGLRRLNGMNVCFISGATNIRILESQGRHIRWPPPQSCPLGISSPCRSAQEQKAAVYWALSQATLNCLTYFSMFRNTTTLKVAIIYNCHLMLQMRSPRLGEVPGGRDDKRQDQDSNPSL